MSRIRIEEQAAGTVPTPPAGFAYIFRDSGDGKFKEKDETGTVTELGTAAPDTTLPIRNESGSPISKGKLLYATGFSSGRVTVDLADNTDPAKRPAICVSQGSIPNLSDADGLVAGELVDVDTSSFAISDQLVLGTSGDFQRPPPDTSPFTGEVQLVGSVTRVDAVNGRILVSCGQGLIPQTGGAAVLASGNAVVADNTTVTLATLASVADGDILHPLVTVRDDVSLRLFQGDADAVPSVGNARYMLQKTVTAGEYLLKVRQRSGGPVTVDYLVRRMQV